MDIEAQTAQNAADIGKLATTVTELATMFKYTEERNKEGREDAKHMIKELQGLNERIGTVVVLKNELGQMGKDLIEVRSRCDQLKEWKDKYDLSSMRGRIESLEKTKQEEAGAAQALSTGADWFWRLFGPFITVLMLGGMGYYFSSHMDTVRESTYIEKSGHGKITGE